MAGTEVLSAYAIDLRDHLGVRKVEASCSIPIARAHPLLRLLENSATRVILHSRQRDSRSAAHDLVDLVRSRLPLHIHRRRFGFAVDPPSDLELESKQLAEPIE